jgi:hypothetical protein
MRLAGAENPTTRAGSMVVAELGSGVRFVVFSGHYDATFPQAIARDPQLGKRRRDEMTKNQSRNRQLCAATERGEAMAPEAFARILTAWLAFQGIRGAACALHFVHPEIL